MARDRVAEAAAAVKTGDGPKTRLARDVVACLSGAGPVPQNGLARALRLLKDRKPQDAVKAATEALDLPLSWRGPVADMIARQQRTADAGAAVTSALVRSHLAATLGILSEAAILDLAQATERVPAEKLFLDLWTAWMHVRFGSSTNAARITS